MALTEAILIQTISGFSDIGADAHGETPLFSSGALDSVAMLNLLAFVEEQAGIEIRADEVTLENFDTPARIVRFAGERSR
ncbi:acyl carrier protein [Sphingobium sp. PNB]|uniref:acyl carrier protein n=1 Tax=Sphingobium sp. PNB TaxID=863934 RepID=UPI001CA4263C|nr:acyl carrier protein [Sphingobium sp. PNB]MCB4858144.1 acyl carrier protein [Sphingobium sp. PNB]